MNDESGESMEPMEQVPLIGQGESELERLRHWTAVCWVAPTDIAILRPFFSQSVNQFIVIWQLEGWTIRPDK